MAIWDNESYGLVAHQVCWFIYTLTTAVVALRFYARLTAKPGNPLGALGLDDTLVALSWAVLLITQIFVQIAAGYGNGKHYNSLSPPDQIEVMKWNTIINAVIIWAFSLPKLAIVALLRRILMFGLRTSVLLWGLAFVGQALIFSMSVFLFIQCNPTEKNWNKDIPGICLPGGTMIGIEYFVTSYSAFLDLFFALFPIPFVMRLKMPLKKRVAVSTSLSLGVLAGVVQSYKLSILGASFEYTTVDPTYPLPFLNTFGLLEASLLLITCSLPALGPLIRKAMNRISQIGGWSVNEIGELTNSARSSSKRSPTPNISNQVFELKFSKDEIVTRTDNLGLITFECKVSDQSDQLTLANGLEESHDRHSSTLGTFLIDSHPIAASTPRALHSSRSTGTLDGR